MRLLLAGLVFALGVGAPLGTAQAPLDGAPPPAPQSASAQDASDAQAEPPDVAEPPVAVTRRGQLADLHVDNTGRVDRLSVLGAEILLESLDPGVSALSEPASFAARLSLPGRKPAIGMFWGPRVVRHADSVSVVAIMARRPGRDGDVFVWRSDDGGAHFGEARRLNAHEGAAREGFVDLALAPDGRLAAAWLHIEDDLVRVQGARTTSGADDWQPDVAFARSTEASVCECCPPALAFAAHGEELWLLYRDDLQGHRDMHLRPLHEPLAAPIRLGDERWRLAACPMSEADLLADEHGVLAAYRYQAELLLARPGEDDLLLGEGLRPQLARTPAGALTVWLNDGALIAQFPGEFLPRQLATGVLRHRLASAPDGHGPVLLAYDVGEHDAPQARLVALTARVD